MPASLRMLVMTEWRESWSGYALGLAVLGGFTFLGVDSRLLPDMIVLTIGTAVGGAILAVIVSMGVIAPQRADGSINTLRALPVHPMLIMLVKLAVATAGLVSVIALSAVIFMLAAGQREITTSQALAVFTRTTIFATSMLAWMIAANVRMRGEGPAGLVSISVAFLLGIISTVLDHAVSDAMFRNLMRWLPWGALTSSRNPTDWMTFNHLWPNLLMTALLWFVAMRRFARVERSRG